MSRIDWLMTCDALLPVPHLPELRKCFVWSSFPTCPSSASSRVTVLWRAVRQTREGPRSMAIPTSFTIPSSRNTYNINPRDSLGRLVKGCTCHNIDTLPPLS
ncbi:hypothetical protein VUR80DRAFT_5692 [Thermomyces stellatus]